MFSLHDNVYCLSVCYSGTRRICSVFMIMFIVYLFVTVVPEGYVRPSVIGQERSDSHAHRQRSGTHSVAF